MNTVSIKEIKSAVISIMALWLIFPVSGQERPFLQADSLYAAGIEAYGQKEYEAAISLFLKCDSLNSASERPEPYCSGNAATWAGSSYYKMGNVQKAKELDNLYYRLAPVDRRLTVKSDSLSHLAMQFAKNEDWHNALMCMEQCAETEKSILGDNHYCYARTLSEIANLHYRAQQYPSAMEYGRHALHIQQQTLGESHPDYAYSLYTLANCYAALGDYNKAIELGTQALNIRKRISGENHPDYATALGDLAGYYYYSGDYAQAVEAGTQASKIIKETLGEKHPSYTTSLNNLASYWLYSGDYAQAIEAGTQASKIIKETLGERHPSYASALNNLASYYSSTGDYDKAVELATQALNIRKQTLGEKHPFYAISLNDLANYYSSLGEYNQAIEAGTQASKIIKEALGEDHPFYATSLGNLANSYSSSGDYNKAVEMGTQASGIIKETLGEKHPSYATALNNLASYYSSLGDYNKAIEMGTKALDIQRQTLGERHPDHATTLNNLASYYSSLGDYNKAIEMGTKALDIQRQTLGERHPSYATTSGNLARCYSSLGDYDKAVEMATQALNTIKEALGEKHPSYATASGNLARYYSFLDDYNRAIEMETQALNIRKQTLGEKHPSYAASLGNLANYYSSLGDCDKAVELGTQASSIIKETLGGKHPSYAITLNNLANYYSSLGNYDKAIELETQAVDIIKEVLGRPHPDYATALGYLAGYYSKLDDSGKTIEYLSDCIAIKCRNIVRNFRNLGAMQRNKYWDMNRIAFNIASLYCLKAPDNALLYGTTYNSELFSKGILLSSEIEFDKVIKESGDTVLLRQFEELRMTQRQLDSYYKQPIAERKSEEVKRLENQADLLEHALIKGCKEYGDFTRRLNIRWPDVQAALGERDVAIEFAVPESDTLKRHIALVLRKGWDAPKYVYIGSANDFAPYWSQGDALYTSQELSDMIWSRILETAQVQDGDNIYFSPDGIFYQIAIEYLPTDDGRIMAEKYNIERLSSTKELCFREQSSKESSAVLYGGLKYDLDSEVIAAESRKYTRSSELRGDDFFQRFIADKNADSLARNTITYLPGTLAEVENISSTLKDNGIKYQTFTAENGNEESFKALSGRTPQIIHIATHGFYLPPTEAELLSKQRQVTFLAMGDEQKANIIDYSMSRTGLLFAGAQTAWSGKPVPENVDDGILTAKEISQLDLRNVDLAVLSACQTALGEITSDGVAGLQRGFKKAGVQTLVMSLWPVNDQATRIMMTAFYENLISGQSKRDAFNHAMLSLRNYETEVEIEIDDTDQQMIYDETADDYIYPKKIIREKLKPYTNPKYWAAFVMLD